MKTLKKSLCLVLALVMVLSMGVISASADLDYEDAEDVNYAEAVDVMSGIGVLEGYEDGTFLPTKEVTRAEAAKIIAYLMIGNAKEADALKTTTDPFADVSKDHWAAGYIHYLVQEDVINGNGNGFDPDGKVKGLEFAKMLLTAVGYGVNGEYVGENWAINVAKDALNYGIFDGNLAGANMEPATREECAQYAFNTLFLQKVTYSALLGGYIENIGVWANDYYNDPNNAESNKADTFANDFGLDDKDLDEDAFYRPEGYVWTIGGKKVISNAYGKDKDLEGAYTVPVTGNELYSLLGKSVVNKIGEADGYTLNVYVDGALVDWDVADIAKANTADLDYTGYGVQTYVYVIGKEVRVCIINTFLAEVEDVQEESKKKDAETTVDFADNTPDYLTKATYETDKFAEDELVLVTYSQKAKEDGIQSMVPATLLDGKITKYTNKGVAKITADGEVYTGAYNDYVFTNTQTAADDIKEQKVKGQTYTLILDEYGYVIGICEPVDAPNNYVYVAQFGQKIDTTSNLSDKTTLSAEIWYADAESETGASKKIVLVDYNKSDIGKDKEGKPLFDAEAFDDNFDLVVKALNGKIEGTEDAFGLYQIDSLSASKVTLKRVSLEGTKGDPNSFVTFSGLDVQKGISRLDANENGRTTYVTTRTQFFYIDGTWGTDLTVKAYNGINKVPTVGKDIKSADAVEGWTTAKYASNGKNVYEAMLVEYDPNDPAAVTSDDYFYLGTYFKVENEAGKFDVSLDVMKNGELTTLDFTNLTATEADDLIKDAQAKYQFSYITKASAKTITNAKDATNGAVTYIDLYDGDTQIYEMYDADDIYETTLYIDLLSAEVEELATYMENAKVVDLREYTEADDYEIGSLTMKALSKLTKDNRVYVCCQYNKYMEVTVVYVVHSEEYGPVIN